MTGGNLFTCSLIHLRIKMAILGNRHSLIDEDLDKKESYTIPAMVRKEAKGISLKKSIFLSAILHPTVIGAVWLIIFILALMGITFSLFEKPKPKMNDIQFVLVDNAKEQMPLNKKTPFRSDRNTRTGGIRDKKRPVSMPSPNPAKKSVAQKAAPGPKAPKHAEQKKPVKHNVEPKNIFKALTQPKQAPKAAPKAAQEARPHPPSARPSIKPPSVPRPSIKPSSPFAVPIPKGPSTGRAYSTGPIGGRGTSSSGGGSSGGGSHGGRYAPVPSLAPTGGGGGSSGSRMSRGGSGYGNAGNPGGGGGAPGIDSIREPDFGPYMRELQRRIKMNWDPPKGNESKRVVLLFKIAKDGRLLSVRVFKSSGVPGADRAALNAVQLTAPFRPLPGDFRGSSIDIQFTFDYNVFGASQY